MQTAATASILGSQITSANIEQSIDFQRDKIEYSAHISIRKYADSDYYSISIWLEATSTVIANPHRKTETVQLANLRRLISPSDNISSLSVQAITLLEEQTKLYLQLQEKEQL